MLTDELTPEGGAAAELRAANVRLLRQLEKAKISREELVEAVYRACRDAAENLEYPPVPKPEPDRRRREGEETAIVVFSDLQLGQVTPTYSTEVAAQRVARYADKVARLVELHRAATPVRNIRVYMLGDLVENELIFPTQPWQVDSSLFAQVALDGPRIIGDFLRRMLALGNVDVVSVPGNHGDVGGPSRKMANPETNFDRMLAAIVRQVFEASGERRITFRIPDGYGRTSWYAVDNVGDVGFLLWHGHQARRMSNSSHLPFYKLVMGWRAGALPEPFTVSLCGHHHTPTMLQMGPVRHFINGTFASDADYAIERLASNSGPAQWLLFTNGKRLTAQYLVDLA